MKNALNKALFVIILAFTAISVNASDGEKVSIMPFSIESIVNYSKQFVGTPYRYGGITPRGFDCSGLLNYVFEKHGMELSRSSAALFNEGDAISLAEVQAGDFLFFKGRNSASSRVGHVALVIGVDDAGIHMIHATRRGVVIDVLEESTYYSPRFLGARRHFDFEAFETIRPMIEAESLPFPRL